jgi:cystathionine gamma-lyase
MAAVGAAIEAVIRPGGVLVAPDDGYPGIRRVADEQLAAWGVEVRFTPTDTEAILAVLPGATAVWVETPSNPALDVCDVPRICAAAREGGARVLVDNTLPTPLLQRPLELGADVSVVSGTKALSGHSDLLLGVVTVADEAWAAELRHARARTGALPGPFEAWLAHRSLATLAIRLERQQATAQALAELLDARADITGVRYPGLPGDPSHAVAVRQMDGFGPVIGFELAGADAAQAFLARLELVAEATSFGGVHATAERRARWGTDRVAPGYIRFSCGIEDTADVLADVSQALDGLR